MSHQWPHLLTFYDQSGQLVTFLLAVRKVYNDFVKYHNFRHACDVTQAVFQFLLRIGTIPPYPGNPGPASTSHSPAAKLLKPFHALALVVGAVGHDVGHPGVNNLFLVQLNTPLAQLYNDRSVLESFHCAAFSQVLRRYWPEAFSDVPMRKLMINSILSTDMSLHNQYIAGLGAMQAKAISNNNSFNGVEEKTLDEYRELSCCLLLKSADICNVVRRKRSPFRNMI